MLGGISQGKGMGREGKGRGQGSDHQSPFTLTKPPARCTAIDTSHEVLTRTGQRSSRLQPSRLRTMAFKKRPKDRLPWG